MGRVVPIRRKVECVCGTLRALHSHRRGKYSVFEVGYEKNGKVIIQKLILRCLTCGVEQTIKLEEKQNGKDKRK